MKQHLQLRYYQNAALDSIFRREQKRVRSGLIVLPCGAGKTLVGMATCARLKESCLCLVPNNMSLSQWKAEFMRKTTATESVLLAVSSGPATYKQHERIVHV